jgi:hypothetical protein
MHFRNSVIKTNTTLLHQEVNNEACQMKPVQGFFYENEYRPLQIVSLGAEAGIPLMFQSIDPLRKELPGLLLKSLNQRRLGIFVWPLP